MFTNRVDESLWAIREKPATSTTLERLRLTREADELLADKPQPQQISGGLCYLLDRVSLPVEPYDLLLGRIAEVVPNEEEEAFFQETVARWDGAGTPPWMVDSGHVCFDWERVLRLGLPGLQVFAEDELHKRVKAVDDEGKANWLQSVVLVYVAFRNYARRYAQAAQEAGLREPAARCAAIADREPRTFGEALQLIWLIAQVYCTCLARNPTLTLGRLDHLLIDLYRRDVANAALTREAAGELIDDFYAKNNLILGRGEHQMSGGDPKATGWARNLTYDAPQYLLLGGRWPDDSPPTNELTELFIERITPGYENPFIAVRYTGDFPEPLWRLACDKMRANASMAAYNDEVAIESYRRVGIAEPAATDWSLYGCNWPTTSGKGRSVAVKRIVLPQHVLNALDAADGAAALDDVYRAFARSLAEELARICADHAAWTASRQKRGPGLLSVDDCFVDGPVANATDWRLGGCPIHTFTLGLVGIATAADSFAALEHVLFGDCDVGLDGLRSALRSNFDGCEHLRELCCRAPKLGRNDPAADGHAVRTLQIVLDEIDKATASIGAIALRALTSDMQHRGLGKAVGATPDGRGAGAPLSENMAPSPGACTDGLSSMLQSLAKLPLVGVQSGTLNIRIDPQTAKGDAGLDKLAAALRTYFELGGLQVQLSFANAEQLREAQQNPQAHRDLMVRVTGYSAVFVDMSESAQNEIIRRAEMEVG